MPTWHPATQKPRDHRHTKQDHNRLGRGPTKRSGQHPPHPPKQAQPRDDQTRPTTHPPHPPQRQTRRAHSKPNWHRLHGTLLSSQRPDTHPPHPTKGTAGGNRSNLPDHTHTVNHPAPGHDPRPQPHPRDDTRRPVRCHFRMPTPGPATRSTSPASVPPSRAAKENTTSDPPHGQTHPHVTPLTTPPPAPTHTQARRPQPRAAVGRLRAGRVGGRRGSVGRPQASPKPSSI